MPATRDTAMIVRAARLYYEQGKSQSDVAEELNLSRSNVSRILTQARDRGIVEFTIHDPEGPPRRNAALESAIRTAFHVSDVHVVSVPRTPGLESVAREGALLVQERARHVRSIGISWGSTVQSVVAHVETMDLRTPPLVLPLVGGHSAFGELESGESVLRVLASRLGARAETLYAPAILESEVTVRSLRAESSIGSVLAAAATVDLAIVGIGSVGFHSSPHLVEQMGLTPEELAEFEAQNPVGDVCGHFVDADGNPLHGASAHRVLAVSLDDLRSAGDVIGIAAGAEKAPGVAGVLRSGALNGVILDEDVARGVLAEVGS